MKICKRKPHKMCFSTVQEWTWTKSSLSKARERWFVCEFVVYVVAHIALDIMSQWSEMLKILPQWVRRRMRYAHVEHMLAVESESVAWTNNKLFPFSLYRCKVPECDVGDNNREISYDQPWLQYAIPQSQNGYENCVRYAPINSSTSSTCNISNFNTLEQIKCTEFIYTTDESNVQTEVILISSKQTNFFLFFFVLSTDAIRTWFQES